MTLNASGPMSLATAGYYGSPGTAGACTSGNANITWATTGLRYGTLG